jgi:hypothetical protein
LSPTGPKANTQASPQAQLSNLFIGVWGCLWASAPWRRHLVSRSLAWRGRPACSLHSTASWLQASAPHLERHGERSVQGEPAARGFSVKFESRSIRIAAEKWRGEAHSFASPLLPYHPSPAQSPQGREGPRVGECGHVGRAISQARPSGCQLSRTSPPSWPFIMASGADVFGRAGRQVGRYR